MAERTRTRRNTLERRCLGKAYKRLFVGSTKGVFKMLEKIKKAETLLLRRQARCMIRRAAMRPFAFVVAVGHNT